MIIQLEPNITDGQKDQLKSELRKIQYKVTPVKTQYANYLVGTGKREFDIRAIGTLPGIKDIHRVSDDYKLVSKKWRVDNTVIDLGDGITNGGGEPTMMVASCVGACTSRALPPTVSGA